MPKPPGLSRRTFVALSGVTTAGAAIGPATTADALATTPPQLSLDFEHRSLGAPITYHRGATIRAASAHTGRYGCRLDPTTTSSRTACLVVDKSGFALGRPYATYSMWFRLVTLPRATDNYANLFEIGNTAMTAPKSQFTVFFRNKRLACDFGYHETMDIGPVPVDGGWHRIQAIVFFGSTTYTAWTRYDGGPIRRLRSADDKTARTVNRLWIHYARTPADYIMDVDDIRLATTRRRPDFFRRESAQSRTTLSPLVTPARLLRVVRARSGRCEADVGQHCLRSVRRRPR